MIGTTIESSCLLNARRDDGSIEGLRQPLVEDLEQTIRTANCATQHNGMKSPSDQVAQELWAREADEHVRYGRGFHWVESPLVVSYINEQITGDPKVDWLTHYYEKYILGKNPPVAKVLSLGCGGGGLERHLCGLGLHGQVDACDFSDGAVQHARALAAQAKIDNIHYFTSDLNRAEFSPETYDIIFSGSALHHISELERLLDQLRGALTECGLLIINEYVGPFKFQWTAQQTGIIDAVLQLLPAKYRARVSAPGQFKDRFLGPVSIAEMDAIDPTESVRSNEIVPLIQERFFIWERKDFGGTILQMLLQDIVGNFDATDPIDAGFLNLLIYIERELIREKVLESDFTCLVAGKSPGGHERASIRDAIDLAERTPQNTNKQAGHVQNSAPPLSSSSHDSSGLRAAGRRFNQDVEAVDRALARLEILQQQVGMVNPRGPGLRNGVIQLTKGLMARV